MRFVLFSAFFFLSCLSAMADDPPVPVQAIERKAPPGMEGLVWNKWDTDHFVVLSIDKPQGRDLFSDIEAVRMDTLNRWGLSTEGSFFCKLVCVPDADMLRKLFGLKEPRCEVSRSKSGDAEFAAIWVDSSRIGLLASLIAEAELEYSPHHAFLRRGVPAVERGAESVRFSLPRASDSTCSSLLDAKASEAALKADPQGFEANCALLCLMLRREYGRKAFGEASSCQATSLHEEMGFGTPADLDATFARFRDNLLRDIEVGATPDEYLSSGR